MKQMMDTEKKLRIGIMTFYYPHLGGSGIITARLAKNLAILKNYDVHIIGYPFDENPLEMEDIGVKLHKVDKINYPTLKNEPYIWTLASQAYNIYKKEGLDLLHANYAVPHALAAYCTKRLLENEGEFLPYVVTGHGSDIHTNGYKRDVNPMLKLSLNSADAITFVSDDLKRTAEDSLGIHNTGIHIPNFVDTSDFRKIRTNLRKKLKIPKGSFVIGHASNFAPVKQVRHFLSLANYLKGNNTLHDVYFIMCGDGRDRLALEESVRLSEVGDYFRFMGRVEKKDIVEAYNAMDVFILPSKHEGCSLSILESMACEVPVIGTNVGGIKETIDEDTGFLFESNNIGELSEIVLKLKRDMSFCKKIGRNGIKRVNEKYSVKKVMKQYYDLYESVVSGRKYKK